MLDVEAYGEEEEDEEDENESLFGKFKKEIAKEFTEEFLNKKTVIQCIYDEEIS